MHKSICFVASTLVIFLLSMSLAQANVQVDFTESAPKDRFTIKNTGGCALNDLTLMLDLSNSAGKLIFDTTASGAGVEVFQPFEISKGDMKLISALTVNDGDTALSLSIPSLPSGEAVSFTIDVDDTLPQSELGKIRVTGAEIARSRLQVRVGAQKPVSAFFDKNSRATAVLAPCPA